MTFGDCPKHGDELYVSCLVCEIDRLRSEVARLTAEVSTIQMSDDAHVMALNTASARVAALESSLRELTASRSEWDFPLNRYITVQVDRCMLAEARALLGG